ncbi:hypothetical protein U9M48_030635 [Paspalum notatum var. saurae]|uniref:Uncharacterized protein n=1 Tax=Paspalum notatum var. saurae TaxID=547442 RepID=A0AAQ3U1B4_PASNO
MVPVSGRPPGAAFGAQAPPGVGVAAGASAPPPDLLRRRRRLDADVEEEEEPVARAVAGVGTGATGGGAEAARTDGETAADVVESSSSRRAERTSTKREGPLPSRVGG